MISLQEKRRLLNQVDSLELALQIKADEVKELKAKLDAEIKGRLQDQHQHEQVEEPCVRIVCKHWYYSTTQRQANHQTHFKLHM